MGNGISYPILLFSRAMLVSYLCVSAAAVLSGAHAHTIPAHGGAISMSNTVPVPSGAVVPIPSPETAPECINAGRMCDRKHECCPGLRCVSWYGAPYRMGECRDEGKEGEEEEMGGGGHEDGNEDGNGNEDHSGWGKPWKAQE